MATTVTVSEFRGNLSKYIDLVNEEGKEIEIVDGRKGKVLAALVKKKKSEFDWDTYMEFVRSLKGSKLFTDEDVESMRRARKATNKRLRNLNW